MNRLMFIGSLVGIALFVWLLLLTFVAQVWFKDFVRDYINRRIEPTVTRSVAVIEREILPAISDRPDTVQGITAEIVRYRADPIRYIDTFARRFTRLTGTTVVDYLHTLRIQEVQRVLRESDRPITDVAFAAGFNNLAHFNAIFKRRAGCSPSQYRKQQGAVGAT